jgi:hypothetical protein
MFSDLRQAPYSAHTIDDRVCTAQSTARLVVGTRGQALRDSRCAASSEPAPAQAGDEVFRYYLQ